MKNLITTCFFLLSFSALAQNTYDPDRLGSLGEYQIPKDMCVSKLSRIGCEHDKVQSPVPPYTTMLVQTTCYLNYEFYNQVTGEYVSDGKTAYVDSEILTTTNEVLVGLNMMTAFSAGAITVQGAKAQNSIHLRHTLNKIRKVLKKNTCD